MNDARTNVNQDVDPDYEFPGPCVDQGPSLGGIPDVDADRDAS